MKCIVTETSPERINAKPVTNEDGTPHVYATMAEARAELRANGYSYNRENQRYYIIGTEYRAYILRADSEEYAEIMEQAEQQAAPEYIEPEHIQTVSGNKIYRSIDPVTGWNVFTVAGRDFWELAEARYFAQCNPTDDAQRATDAEPEPAQVAAEAESLKDVDAYAHDAKTNANAAAWALDRMTKDHRETAAELARFARTCADLAKDAADSAAASYEHARRTYYADYQTSTYAAQALAIRAEQRDDAQKEAQRAEETAQKVEAIAARAAFEANRPSPEDDAPAPIYQRYELLAFLGDPSAYDVDAIEAEATAYDYSTGRTYWIAFGDDLAAIAERHELYSYAPAI